MNYRALKVTIMGIISILIMSGFNTSLSEQTKLTNNVENDTDIKIIDSSYDYISDLKNLKIIRDNTSFLPCDVRPDKVLVHDDFSEEPIFALGELIVKFNSNVYLKSDIYKKGIVTTDISSINDLNTEYNVYEMKKIFPHIKSEENRFSHIYKVKFSSNVNVYLMAKKFQSNPYIEYAEPNYIFQIDETPNDPNFDEQWSLHNTGQTGGTSDADIDAPEAWDIETGRSEVVLAVIDTGVDYNHPDLAENIWINLGEDINGNGIVDPDDFNGIDDDDNGFVDDIRGWDFSNEDNNPIDYKGHGTHCSGIASAVTNNDIGIAGVCWNCTIMPVKIFPNAYSDVCAKAIYYAANNSANVISMSWGGYRYSELIHDAIEYAANQGVILVASAGNDNTPVKHYPSGYDNVIAVAATNENDERCDEDDWGYGDGSNYGGEIDIAAPGNNIYSTVINNDYEVKSGTSMSCPHVSGLVGLILSKNPNFTREEVRTILRSTTDIVYSDEYIGVGRINAYLALQRNSTPIVNLDSTLDDAIVQGIINISGTANGTDFQQYSVYIGESTYPNSWTEIKNSTIPVSGDILTSWDTGSVDDGTYSIKLEVTNTSIWLSEDRTIITVDNIKITSLLNNDIFRLGDVLKINGTVWKTNFLNYTIEYGLGENPTEWSTNGINLTDNGFSKIINGTLATWNTSFLPGKNFYTLRLTINLFDSQSKQEIIRNIYLDPTLKEGWPQRIYWDELTNTPHGNHYFAGLLEPVVSDIDNDGINEIIVYSAGDPPKIYVYGPDGDLLNKWSVDIEYHGGLPGLPGGNIEAPTLADIDNDDYEEIIVTGMKKIFIYDHTGFLLNTITFPESPFLSNLASGIVASDLDYDGSKNIIRKFSVSNDDPNIIQSYKLAVFNSMGNLEAGWPQTYYNLEDTIFKIGFDSTPAIGNFDDDPEREIVLAGHTAKYVGGYPDIGGLICVFNMDGSMFDGYPKYFDQSIASSPSVADINNDGYDEIVFESDGIYVVDRFGNNVSGWPQLTGEAISTSPAIGDLNNDGSLEIVVSTTGSPFNTYVFDNEGNICSGWPQQTSWNDYRSPVIGDVNGDGNPDVITSAGNGVIPYHPGDGGVYAWNFDGTLIDGFPKVTEMDAQGAATIADIDNDGMVEIIASSDWDTDFETGEGKDRGSIYVWELNSNYDQETMEWPMFHHDAQRTGLYIGTEHDDDIPPTVNITKPENALYIRNRKILPLRKPLIIGKIDIEVEASDEQSGIEKVEFYIDDQLKSTDNTYPYNWTWKRGTLIKHRHTLTVIAYDSAQNSASEELVVRRFL